MILIRSIDDVQTQPFVSVVRWPNISSRISRSAAACRKHCGPWPSDSLDDIIKAVDTHVGTVEDVIASLAADSTLDRATDITFQVRSIDPPHTFILRSIELVATNVAPALGWTRQAVHESALAASG